MHAKRRETLPLGPHRSAAAAPETHPCTCGTDSSVLRNDAPRRLWSALHPQAATRSDTKLPHARPTLSLTSDRKPDVFATHCSNPHSSFRHTTAYVRMLSLRRRPSGSRWSSLHHMCTTSRPVVTDVQATKRRTDSRQCSTPSAASPCADRPCAPSCTGSGSDCRQSRWP